MSVVFACAGAHAPGILGWTYNAPRHIADGFHATYRQLGERLRAAKPDAIVIYTTDHWSNFFLNNFPAFCVVRAAGHSAPHEPFLGPRVTVPGDPVLAGRIINACYDNGFEVSLSEEVLLDHGTMVPLHFLTPDLDVPVVPIMMNAIAPPLPSIGRCYQLGRTIGAALQHEAKRVAVVGTGGISHRPGEPRAGKIDSDFDRAFLHAFCEADEDRLRGYTTEEVAEAGYGAQEIRMWVAVAGTVPGWKGEVLAYEPVPQWNTGCGLAVLDPPA